MPRPIPPPLSVVLTTLRAQAGWTESELAADLGVSKSLISDYERGKKNLRRERLEVLAARLGYGPHDIDRLLLGLEGLPAAPHVARSPVDVSAQERRRIRQLAAGFGLVAADLFENHAVRAIRSRRARQARREAARCWARLRAFGPAERRRRVESSAEIQSWAMAERLAHESERAAADRADLALELAQLGLRVAELAPGEPAWRSRCLGYCWGFVANARRVGDDLEGAEEAFREAWRLWRAGEGADPDLLAEWRLLDREASLRRDQREFTAALALLARARASAPAGQVPRILLNRAFTLEQAGRPEEALAELRAAASLVEASGQPRLRFALQFNVITNLCPLGRYEEAEDLLPRVQELVIGLGNELDLVRVLWLSGRVAGGRGRRQEARAKLGQALREFAARGKGYDSALVALELAVLLLEEGRRAEVRALAGELLWVFTDKGIHREALAALTLFRRAVEAETLSLEQARRLLAYLERARHDPRLRFEGDA
jgi:transcriptional regulator with XRE-family HTH domain